MPDPIVAAEWVTAALIVTASEAPDGRVAGAAAAAAVLIVGAVATYRIIALLT